VEGVLGLETAASLLIFWVILGLAAGPSMSDEGLETGDTTAVPWLRVAVGYWIALLLVLAVVMLATSLPDHPGTSMALWLCAILLGVSPALPSDGRRDRSAGRRRSRAERENRR